MKARCSDFAKAYKYEESVAALSAMSGVKIATLDRLIAGDRYDPILIVGKTIGLEWATVRALILLRLGPNRAAVAGRHRRRAGQFRAADAVDRRAGGDFWKTPRPGGVIASERAIARMCSAKPQPGAHYAHSLPEGRGYSVGTQGRCQTC